MRIIKESSFAATPWKNGGGVTHEAIRVPAGEAAFRWRVSVAQIDQPGPFSDFVGYERFMVLLRGAGVRLTFNGRDHAELRRAGDMVRFDGASATVCDLLRGPCADLNLMISKSINGTRAWVERLEKPRSLNPGDGTVLVFAIAGELSLGAGASLGEWDLAVSAGDATVAVSAARPESPAPLVFFAALNDNSA